MPGQWVLILFSSSLRTHTHRERGREVKEMDECVEGSSSVRQRVDRLPTGQALSLSPPLVCVCV